MNPYIVSRILQVMLPIIAFALSAEDNLVEANLAQARAINTVDSPPRETGLRKARQEIEARLKDWNGKLLARPGEAELLAGIPETTLRRAREVTDDATATASILRQPVPLEMILALAAVRNPDARAAYQNWRAMTRQFEQASFLEDLLSQYRSFTRELDTVVGPQTHKEMPSATFPFPSSLALKGQMIDLESEMARLAYLQAVKTAVNQAANEFFEVQAMGHELDLVRKSRDLYDQIVKSTRSQLESGKANQADLLKAQSQLANLDDQVEILHHHRQHHMAQINILLALPAYTEWGEIIETDLRDQNDSAERLADVAHKENPEIVKAQRAIEMQEVTVRMAETMAYPRASAGMSLLSQSQGAEAGPTRNDMTTFPEHPMVNTDQAGFGANAAYIDELRVRIREARAKSEAMIAKVDFMIDHARFTYHVAERNQKTYARVVVPKAQQTYELSKKHFAFGDSVLTDFLQTGRDYFDGEKMLNDYRRDRNKALVDMQDAIGGTAASLLPAAATNTGTGARP